ncbi:uncharacterized protein LOC6555302 [Drosophila erecta]|uniref:GG11107 n=1 Tax=Drosophila erecta TaxID=7220 RepID=B3P7N2_DROER|nr:uncharacterized protein LOC6555302 [Drosophila erecta]EDV54193.1 uncharacterized protein Dere_GG11107 [Drosophila erecta]
MSDGQMANQLNVQQQQQHPLLSAIAANNYAQTQRVHYYPNHYNPSHYLPGHYHQGHQGYPGYQGHQAQQGRPTLLAAASSHNGAYAATAAGSGHSGYGGIEPSVEYELEPEPPSGSFSSFHPSSAGSGPAYPSDHHPPSGPPPAPPAPPPSKSSKKSKKSSGSVMNALTLLSFFFFVNMLQNCLKDHMADMNPTVMVLTASGTRNRFNKLAEMNSREQTSTTATESAAAAAVAAASSWNHQAALVPAVEPSVPPSIVAPTVVLQSPYSGHTELANKPPHQYQPPAPNPQQKPHDYRPTHHLVADDDVYNYNGQRRPPPQTFSTSFSTSSNDGDFYPNRTHIDHSSRPDFESDSGSDYYQHHYNPYAGANSRRHPWSYGRRRYSSAPWSSASLGAQSGVSSYLDNAQRRQGDDDDGHGYGNGYGYGYGHRDRDRDRDRDADADADGYWDEDGQQRRRSDAFYTRTRIN